MSKKFIISRIEALKNAGISKKTGNPYSLDFTNVIVQLPVSNDNSIGFKEFSYQYGKSDEFQKLKPLLEGRLPLECEMELDLEVSEFGNSIMVIKDLKIPPVNTKAVV